MKNIKAQVQMQNILMCNSTKDLLVRKWSKEELQLSLGKVLNELPTLNFVNFSDPHDITGKTCLLDQSN